MEVANGLQCGPAWTEDRALLGSNPSADPGAKTEAGCRTMPRFVFRDETASGLAQSDKSIKECTLPYFLFSSTEVSGNCVLVRQLRGPHFRT